MNASAISALAALVGAAIGGLTSVLASWLSQHTQARVQFLTHEYARRQELYKDFIERAARCYIDALQHDEPDMPGLIELYAKIARIRVLSSPKVVQIAEDIGRNIRTFPASLSASAITKGRHRKRGRSTTFVDLMAACCGECWVPVSLPPATTLSGFQATRWISNAFLDIDCYAATCEFVKCVNLWQLPTDHAHADRRDRRRGGFCYSGRNIGANKAGDAERDTVDIAEGSAPGVD
jgi:hypothetical protein